VPESRIRGVRRDVAWLLAHAADLGRARLPGTARHWTQPGALDAVERARRDVEAAADRAVKRAHGMASRGASPAPLRLDVSEVLVDLLATADDLAERAAQALGRDRLPHAPSAYADPSPYLRLLHDVAGLLATDERMESRAVFDALSDESGRLCATVGRALGLVEDGLVLDAECPWCRRPRSLRYTVDLHHAPGCDRSCVPPWWTGDVPLEACWRDALIVCTSRVCEPPPPDLEATWRGLPAWSVARSGEWLLGRIRHAETSGAA
jgi:hypothetical protein